MESKGSLLGWQRGGKAGVIVQKESYLLYFNVNFSSPPPTHTHIYTSTVITYHGWYWLSLFDALAVKLWPVPMEWLQISHQSIIHLKLYLFSYIPLVLAIHNKNSCKLKNNVIVITYRALNIKVGSVPHCAYLFLFGAVYPKKRRKCDEIDNKQFNNFIGKWIK